MFLLLTVSFLFLIMYAILFNGQWGRGAEHLKKKKIIKFNFNLLNLQMGSVDEMVFDILYAVASLLEKWC